MRIRIATALVLVLAGMLTACGTSLDPQPPKSTTSATAKSPRDGALAFGTGGTYAPGFNIAVGKPAACTLTEAESVDQGLDCVVFRVKFSNRTTSDVGLFSMDATLTSGVQDAVEVYAPKQRIKGLRGIAEVEVPEGKSHKFRLGFAVEDPDDLVLDIGSRLVGDTMRFATQ